MVDNLIERSSIRFADRLERAVSRIPDTEQISQLVCLGRKDQAVPEESGGGPINYSEVGLGGWVPYWPPSGSHRLGRRRSRWIECEHLSRLWISTKPSSLAAAPAETARSESLGTRPPAENRGLAQDAGPGRPTPQPARVTPAGRCAHPGNA
jgi:hypothetical protein